MSRRTWILPTGPGRPTLPARPGGPVDPGGPGGPMSPGDPLPTDAERKSCDTNVEMKE